MFASIVMFEHLPQLPTIKNYVPHVNKLPLHTISHIVMFEHLPQLPTIKGYVPHVNKLPLHYNISLSWHNHNVKSVPNISMLMWNTIRPTSYISC